MKRLTVKFHGKNRDLLRAMHEELRKQQEEKAEQARKQEQQENKARVRKAKAKVSRPTRYGQKRDAYFSMTYGDLC